MNQSYFRCHVPIVHVPPLIGEIPRSRLKVTVKARTVGAMILELDVKFPGIKNKILDEEGNIRSYVNIFANGVNF